MNILSIGNSYSEDAHRYIHRIARADKFELNTANLFIGGCSLSTHYRNMLSDKEKYILSVNGEITGFPVSLKEALLNRSWDVITLQQVSLESPYYETYQPYLNKIAEYVRLCCPKAKLVIHQTWAYEQGSKRLNEIMGYKDRKEMFNDLENAYQQAAKDINADFIIPSGKILQMLLDSGVQTVHRDTVHTTLGLGRYAIGLLWYKLLTRNDIQNNSFSDFDEEVTESEVLLAKKCVEEICSSL